MGDLIVRLVEDYGYLALAFSLALGSAGLPLPGESALLVAAAFAATGQLSIWGVLAVATVAVILGDAAGYWVGRKGGRALLARYGGWLRLDEGRIASIDGFFARHGPRTVFFGRFVSGLQTYAALFAGIGRMPYARFTAYNVAGGIVWAALYGTLGYVFGRNLGLLERVVKYAGGTLLAAVVLVVAGALAWRWVSKNRSRLAAYGNAFLSYPLVARLRERYDRQLRWLLRRLTLGQYLGLHLTAGLLAAVGCVWLFGGLAEDLLTNDPIVRLDRSVAQALHDAATPATTTAFLIVTALGSLEAVALLGLAVAAYYGRKRRWLHVQVWITVLLGGFALNQLLKVFFARPRPVFEDPLVLESTYSFPSGHAMESMVMYGMLAYFAVRALSTWRARTAVVFGAAVLVLLIGFSRMYLGVHYLSDVAAGYAAGGAWLSACITGMEVVLDRRNRSKGARRKPSAASGAAGG